MPRTSVFVVTSGSYEFLGVFSSRQLANEAIKRKQTPWAFGERNPWNDEPEVYEETVDGQ